MRLARHVAPLALGSMLTSTALAADAKDTRDDGPKSTITKVTVFADRAEVTRRLHARCERGTADATFFPLPLAIDPRTLRGEVSGAATAIGASSREVPLEGRLDERAEKLTQEIRALDREQAALDDEDATASERERTVGAYAGYFRAALGEWLRDAKPDVPTWTKALDGTTKERSAIAEARVERASKRRHLAEARERLRRQLEALRPSEVKSAIEAVVAVDCKGQGEVDVELHYVIGGATWHPEYDLAFSPAGGRTVGPGRAELTVGAVVQQSTGEDWSKVELALSTAKPKLGTEAPLPRALYLGAHEEERQKVMVQAEERRDELTTSADKAAGGQPQAELEDRGQSFVLTLPSKVSVVSDGRPYWMPVDVRETAAESRYVAIPKLRPYVFQVVKLTNPASYPLLAGRVHTYRNGSYVGDAQLAYKGPSEPIEASLGIDEELRVERTSITDAAKRAGFLSGTQHLEQGWRIEVENRAKGPVTVEVKESIPVSKDAKIEVEILKDKTTPGYALDAERGFVVWKLELPKGAKKAVDLTHAVHLPKDWKVGG